MNVTYISWKSFQGIWLIKEITFCKCHRKKLFKLGCVFFSGTLNLLINLWQLSIELLFILGSNNTTEIVLQRKYGTSARSCILLHWENVWSEIEAIQGAWAWVFQKSWKLVRFGGADPILGVRLRGWKREGRKWWTSKHFGSANVLDLL